jgi:ketosteroid isomerase-like protein
MIEATIERWRRHRTGRALAHCRDTHTRMVLIGVALAAALVAAGCMAKPAAPAAAAPPPGLVDGVKGTIEQWRQAYEIRSIDALAKLYSHGPGLTIVEDGALQLGWAAIEPALRGRLARATAIHVRLAELQVVPLGGDAALASATMTRESTDGTTTVTENGIVTLALRKDDTGWVIAGEHYSYKRP